MRFLTACARLYADQPLKSKLISTLSSFKLHCPLSAQQARTPLETNDFIHTRIFYHHVDLISSISNANLNGGKADERVWDQIKPARFSTLILLLLVCHHSESLLLSIKHSMNSIHTDKEDRRMKKRERVKEKNEGGEEGRGKQDRGLVRQTALCLDYHWCLCPVFHFLSLTLFFSFVHYSSIHLAFHVLSMSPSCFFSFQFLSLEITTHSVPTI